MVRVRLMTEAEAASVIDYFWTATPEHLEMIGVDPARLPPAAAWRQHYQREFALPLPERKSVLVTWCDGDLPIGFSTADKIAWGEQANMHLHITEPDRRREGLGAACVQKTAELYFETLGLRRLFCEPNAFNTAPNRTLQKAGFRYVKTYLTVPGPLNFHQAVTRWVLER